MSTNDEAPGEMTPEQLDEGTIEAIGNALGTLVDHREVLLNTLPEFRSRHALGEDIQDGLASFLLSVGDGDLPTTLHLGDVLPMEDLVDECIERDTFDSERRDELFDVWSQIEWAAPAGTAMLQEQTEDAYYWTETAEGFAGVNDKNQLLYAEHVDHGVDELWDITVPLSNLLQRNVEQISVVMQILEDLPPSVTVNDEELEHIKQLAQGLSGMTGNLAETVENEQQNQKMPGPDDVDFDDFIQD